MNQLTRVTWQDGTSRRYHYEHATGPGLLTGISDERGVRIGRYTYSTTGAATRTEGPDATRAVDIVQLGNGRTDVIDRSQGTPITTSYAWQEVQGLIRPVAASAPCPLCTNSQATTDYSRSGEVSRTVGHDGRVTFYQYDDRGREIEQAIFGSTHARATARPALALAESVTSTTWHARWNLPLQRAAPGQVTRFQYDLKGQLIRWTRQATSDASGVARFAAARVGSEAVETYVYSSSGLISSSADFVDGAQSAVWGYLFNAKGDLTRLKSTESGATSSLDLEVASSGLWTRLVESNGALATFKYSPRGRLTTAQTPNDTAVLNHDARGSLLDIQFGTGPWLRVVYDDAGEAVRLEDSNGFSRALASLDPQTKDHPIGVPARPSRPGRHWSAVLQAVPLPAAQAQSPAQFSRGIAAGLSRMGYAQAGANNGADSEPGCNCQTTPTPAVAWQEHVRRSTTPIHLVAAMAQAMADQVAEELLIFKSARKLKRNMCAANVAQPPGCFETHHIVSARGFDKIAAEKSRAILTSFGIDVDDWENGVFLACDKHRNANNGDYDRNVLRDLQRATNSRRGGVTLVLRNIAAQLDQGTYR